MTMTGQIDKPKLESKLQRDDVIPYLKKKGAYIIKIHVGAFQKKGDSDVICCYKGRFVAFELKRSSKHKPSKIQIYRIKKIRDAGGIAKAVSSIKEIEEVLHEISRVQQDCKS